VQRALGASKLGASLGAVTVAEQEHHYEIAIPGKYTEIEEAILIWLYEHPGLDASTDTFTRMFNPGLNMFEPSQELREALGKTQFAIETLVEHRLVRGERFERGMVLFLKLRLTPKGEAEAITQKRRPKTLIHNVPRPDRSKEDSGKP
jgi:hypothetical protein